MVSDGIEDIIGYQFNNKALLEQALRTKAYSNENYCKNQSEFQTLGDAVLKLVITDLLMDKGYRSRASITISRIEQERKEGLANVARNLGIEPFMILGRGQKMQNHGCSDNVLAETLEAIAGAIYRDGGFDNTKNIMKKWFDE